MFVIVERCGKRGNLFQELQMRNLKQSALALLVLLVVAKEATAQSASAGECAKFDAAIQSSLMNIAVFRAEGLADNSAPRAQHRDQQTANELQLIDINLRLMQPLKCAWPTTPIASTTYLSNALACEQAIQKATSPTATPEACDRSKWTPAKS